MASRVPRGRALEFAEAPPQPNPRMHARTLQLTPLLGEPPTPTCVRLEARLGVVTVTPSPVACTRGYLWDGGVYSMGSH